MQCFDYMIILKFICGGFDRMLVQVL